MSKPNPEEMGLSDKDRKMMEVNPDQPDLSEDDISEIQSRLSEQGQKDVSELSEAELKALDIKKTVGSQGEEVYDLGYSPDTGKVTQEMHIKVGTEKKVLTDQDIKDNEDWQIRNKAEWDKRRKEGFRLPSRDDE